MNGIPLDSDTENSSSELLRNTFDVKKHFSFLSKSADSRWLCERWVTVCGLFGPRRRQRWCSRVQVLNENQFIFLKMENGFLSIRNKHPNRRVIVGPLEVLKTVFYFNSVIWLLWKPKASLLFFDLNSIDFWRTRSKPPQLSQDRLESDVSLHLPRAEGRTPSNY